MILFVTLRFLSNLSITLIASLFHFLHVSLVCFNVSCINQLKLSIIVSIICVLQYAQILTLKMEGGGRGGFTIIWIPKSSVPYGYTQ